MIRILLADDQTLVRDGFRSILEHEPDLEVVGEAGDGREAVESARRLSPDVVLMDIRMPVMDGLEATRRLLADPNPPRILVVTTFDLDEYVYKALEAGASGFLLKDVRSGQLKEAIRTVAAGESLLSPAITRRLIEEYVRRPAPGQLSAQLAQLTERELEVLRLLARGLSNQEIAARLVVSEHTARTHVAHIFSKLGLRDRVHAVVLAYECGLVQPGAAPADEGRAGDQLPIRGNAPESHFRRTRCRPSTPCSALLPDGVHALQRVYRARNERARSFLRPGGWSSARSS